MAVWPAARHSRLEPVEFVAQSGVSLLDGEFAARLSDPSGVMRFRYARSPQSPCRSEKALDRNGASQTPPGTVLALRQPHCGRVISAHAEP